jgi:hypothetical protein
MPSINEAVKQNQSRVANGGNLVEAVTPAPYVPAPGASAPPIVSPGLPVRGVFTPNQILATDFSEGTQAMRKGANLRSAMFPPQQSPTIIQRVTQITNNTGPSAPLTLDDVPDGVIFKRVAQIDGNNQVTISTSLNSQASTIATLSTSIPFTFTTFSGTLSYLAISWIAQTVFRPDGSTVAIPASVNGYIPAAPTLSETAGGTLIAAPAFQQSTSQSNASGTTVTGPAMSPLAAGDFLCVSVRWTGATTLNSISDSQGNAGWVSAGAAQAIASGGTVQLWYLPSCLTTASNTLTYHFSGATTAIYSSYGEFKNVLAVSPLRANTSTSGTGLSLNSGNITPTVGDLVISYAGMTSSPSSLTATAPVNFGSQLAGTIEAFAYLPTSAGGATAGTYTSGTSLGWGCGVAAFKPVGVTYRAMVGLVDVDGNVVGISSVTSFQTDPNTLLVVTSPPQSNNNVYAGWVPIVGTTTDTEAVQSATITFGTNWTEPASGLLAAAVASQMKEADIANTGSFLFYNLAASTAYIFYPYWDGLRVRFSGGANTVASLAFSSAMFADGNTPLSATSSGFSATTATAGGGSGGGSGGGCVRKGSRIIPLGHDGVGIEMPQSDWIELRTENGCHLVATPNHPVYTSRGKTPLSEVVEGDLLVTDKGESKVLTVCAFNEDGIKIKFEMPDGHLFWAGESDSSALALSHNLKI